MKPVSARGQKRFPGCCLERTSSGLDQRGRNPTARQYWQNYEDVMKIAGDLLLDIQLFPARS
jgi:hypothetical protein